MSPNRAVFSKTFPRAEKKRMTFTINKYSFLTYFLSGNNQTHPTNNFFPERV